MNILATIATLLIPTAQPGLPVQVTGVDEHAPNYLVVKAKKEQFGIVVRSCSMRWNLGADLLLIPEGKTLWVVSRQRYQATWVMMDQNNTDTLNVLEESGELCRAEVN